MGEEIHLRQGVLAWEIQTELGWTGSKQAMRVGGQERGVCGGVEQEEIVYAIIIASNSRQLCLC